MYEPICLCKTCADEYRTAGKNVVPDYTDKTKDECELCRCFYGMAYLIDRAPVTADKQR